MRNFFLYILFLMPVAGICQQVDMKQFRPEGYTLTHHAYLQKQDDQNLLIAATAIRHSALADEWQQPVLMSVSQNGEVNWAWSYEYYGDNFQVSDLEVGADGTIYIAGAGNLIRATPPTPFLIATTAQGKLKWCRFYLDRFSEVEVRVESAANGNLYMGMDGSLELARINPATGNPIWVKDYPCNSGTVDMKEFLVGKDGSLIVLAELEDPNHLFLKHLVMKVNPDGSVSKARIISVGDYNHALDLTITQDMKVVITGQGQDWTEYLMALDWDLEEVWVSKPFGNQTYFSSYVAATIETSEGELVTSGTIPYDFAPHPPGLTFYSVKEGEFQPGKQKSSRLGSTYFDHLGAEMVAAEDEVFLAVLSKPNYMSEWAISLGSFSNDFRFCSATDPLLVPLEGLTTAWTDCIMNINDLPATAGTELILNEFAVTVVDSAICDSSQFPCAVEISLGPDTTICGGKSHLLNPVLPAGYKALWSTGATTDSILVTASGTYSVMTWVDNAYGCDTLYDTITVIMPPLPEARYSFTPEMPEPGEIVLFTDGTAGAVSRKWYFGDGGTSIDSLARYSYPLAGEYRVKLVVADSFGCHDSVLFKIRPYAFSWFMPTAFSPDNNEVNEGFAPVGIGISRYELEIFNRWGQQVFYGNNTAFDGTSGDNPLPEGVYLYRVRVWDVFNKWETASGNVTLVR
ncbi:MAG: gliding motility-associated C-terminal domain-containing protein [Bacteroidia bacterium]